MVGLQLKVIREVSVIYAPKMKKKNKRHTTPRRAVIRLEVRSSRGVEDEKCERLRIRCHRSWLKGEGTDWW